MIDRLTETRIPLAEFTGTEAVGAADRVRRRLRFDVELVHHAAREAATLRVEDRGRRLSLAKAAVELICHDDVSFAYPVKLEVKSLRDLRC